MTLWNHPAKFGGQRHCGSGDIFLIYHINSHMTTCSKGWVEAPHISHHFAKFNSHRPRNSTDIRDLRFLINLQDYVIKGSCNFVQGTSSLYTPSLPNLVAIGFVVEEI